MVNCGGFCHKTWQKLKVHENLRTDLSIYWKDQLPGAGKLQRQNFCLGKSLSCRSVETGGATEKLPHNPLTFLFLSISQNSLGMTPWGWVVLSLPCHTRTETHFWIIAGINNLLRVCYCWGSVRAHPDSPSELCSGVVAAHTGHFCPCHWPGHQLPFSWELVQCQLRYPWAAAKLSPKGGRVLGLPILGVYVTSSLYKPLLTKWVECVSLGFLAKETLIT